LDPFYAYALPPFFPTFLSRIIRKGISSFSLAGVPPPPPSSVSTSFSSAVRPGPFCERKTSSHGCLPSVRPWSPPFLKSTLTIFLVGRTFSVSAQGACPLPAAGPPPISLSFFLPFEVSQGSPLFPGPVSSLFLRSLIIVVNISPSNPFFSSFFFQ